MLTQEVLAGSQGSIAAIGREPFLAAMASNELPPQALGRWAREDTHFLHALRRMMAQLIVDAPDEKSVDVITGAYPALQFELDRFAEEARRLGQPLGEPPAPVTARFNDLLRESADAGFHDGIATYWLVELAYLEAWASVRERVGLAEPYGEWIENWTSDAFRDFVGALGALVDEHADPEATRRRASEVFFLEQELWRWCFEGK